MKVELYEVSDTLWWSSRMKENNIICGPDYYGPVAQNSLGIQLFESLINNDENNEAFIHAETSETLQYSEILKTTCKLAESMRKAGYKQNDFISICSENSLYFFIPVIAGLYNGMILAPLNTSYSHGELLHATGITKPKIIFCSKQVVEKMIKLKRTATYIEKIIVVDTKSLFELRLQKGNAVGVETLEGFISKHCDTYFDEYSFKPLDLDPREQLAVILCSSGTTGLPKGVMTTHYNINVRINQINDPRISTDMYEGYSMFGLLPFFHGYGFMVTLTNIIRGNKIIVISRFEEKLFLECIVRYQVTHLHLVPPLLVFLSKHPMVSNYDLSCVMEIISGAAPLSKETQELVKKRIKNADLRQGYGLTEATLAVTLTPIGESRDGSSGKVVSGMQCAVRDPTGDNLGVNQIGELYLKGDMVTKGYYGNPQATAECFGEDDWLKTGDIGYYDEDEHFYIVDRLKELIKYKGFQVPPAELEALLLTNTNIKECGVVGLPDEVAGELPFGFVVKQPGSNLTEKEVLDFVAERVSNAKRLHGGVSFVQSIPKNPSGKILRRELKEMLKTHKSKL